MASAVGAGVGVPEGKAGLAVLDAVGAGGLVGAASCLEAQAVSSKTRRRT